MGIDFKIKTLTIGDQRVKMLLWDTAGQEKFRTITNAYYRGANGVVLVYDVTDEYSFMNIRSWMHNIHQHAQDNIAKCIVGNKCDMTQDRAITQQRAMDLADEYGVPYFETSARTNINVEEMFVCIAKQILQTQFDEQALQEHRKGSIINLQSNTSHARKKCACSLL
eukprot:CAMPEP_0202712244 /NCGR_PEP_ID=MMETSP1385-20130828/36140_1 /ASSEMBLY_ACC=CAM_ASM_000861 /TAXON_ID=933848 /ORGANISM="Elphidium margaritaceum" /LENGTH=166 /DNA_ID=CAMNT_0049372213 /DNA_START=157 /DNA_END=657 /DNA_ORIENTATION=+